MNGARLATLQFPTHNAYAWSTMSSSMNEAVRIRN